MCKMSKADERRHDDHVFAVVCVRLGLCFMLAALTTFMEHATTRIVPDAAVSWWVGIPWIAGTSLLVFAAVVWPLPTHDHPRLDVSRKGEPVSNPHDTASYC